MSLVPVTIEIEPSGFVVSVVVNTDSDVVAKTKLVRNVSVAASSALILM